MNLSPESVKKTLLNKVNELSASSWQYTKKPTDFTRNRKISFSDVLLSTISMVLLDEAFSKMDKERSMSALCERAGASADCMCTG